MGSQSKVHINLILIRLVLNYLMEFLLGRMISNENLALPKCCFACLKIKLMEDKKYSETFTHINLLFF